MMVFLVPPLRDGTTDMIRYTPDVPFRTFYLYRYDPHDCSPLVLLTTRHDRVLFFCSTRMYGSNLCFKRYPHGLWLLDTYTSRHVINRAIVCASKFVLRVRARAQLPRSNGEPMNLPIISHRDKGHVMWYQLEQPCMDPKEEQYD